MDKPDPNATLKMQLEHLRALQRRVGAFGAGVPIVQADASHDAAPGEPGPMGPMPMHEWSGTEIRFQQGPNGVWGKWTDIQGNPGRPGASYGPVGGGGAANPAPTNYYFPAGW